MTFKNISNTLDNTNKNNYNNKDDYKESNKFHKRSNSILKNIN